MNVWIFTLLRLSHGSNLEACTSSQHQDSPGFVVATVQTHRTHSLLQAASHRFSIQGEENMQHIVFSARSSLASSLGFGGAVAVIAGLSAIALLAMVCCRGHGEAKAVPGSANQSGSKKDEHESDSSPSKTDLRGLKKMAIKRGKRFQEVQQMNREELEEFLAAARQDDDDNDETAQYDKDDSFSIPISIFDHSDSMSYTIERDQYDPEAIPEHIKKTYGSWKLLMTILGVLTEFWIALAFMYWSLLFRGEELMDCKAYPQERPHSGLIRHSCYYTHACLRGFPILAANVTLVLMVRILLQSRLYYTMIKDGYVLDFAGNPVLRTVWPWLCGFSMIQGGLHFALKAYFFPGEIGAHHMYALLVRKFVLPGLMFFHILVRHVDIENTLVPLNRLIELDYTKDSTQCPWMAKIRALNELVLAYDTAHRDVIGDTLAEMKKSPSLEDVVQNMIKCYDDAHRRFGQQKHHSWGLFRSMWVASILLDVRLDRNDPDTHSWLCAFGLLAAGCIVTSALSFYFLFHSTSEAAWQGVNHLLASVWIGGLKSAETEQVLANTVLVIHAILILVFIYRAIRSMFYFHPEVKQLMFKSLQRTFTPRRL